MTTEEILGLLQDVAARVITPRFRALASGEIDEKTPGDYVTIADREAEVEIAAGLRAAFPHALIVGEEASFEDPRLMGKLPEAAHAFVIDPVDGTRNFVHGNPDHAVLLAELRAGEVVRGWIWQPEHQAAFVTERGSGVTRNGVRLEAVARTGTLRVEGSSWRELRPLVESPDWSVARTSFCCGIDYPRLLVGDVEALLYRNPKPWDHSAGALMMEEIGAVARLLDGSPYAPGVPHGVLLAAASAEIWDRVADAIGASAT